ncbi:MAG: Acylphosphatase [Candidatus Syntrophoarchaeum sp. GoM_oil]|nr:MAG: Acylphosphatase [Candidatus Syntrophoarchaeum sp. GoM_oil]
MSDERWRIHIIVSGRVQGVFFRYATRSRAEELGLDGWVRNLYDGRVEVLSEGARGELEKLLAFTEHGPPGASVDDLRFEWEDSKADVGVGFKIATTSENPFKDR